MYNPEEFFTDKQPIKEKITEQNFQLLVIFLLIGAGYYFFIYLNKKREEARTEIKKLFQQNSSITTAELDASLWKYKDSWEEYLDELYLGSQISSLTKEMKSAVGSKRKEKQKAENDEKERKEQAIRELWDSLKLEENNLPEFKNIIEKYSQKINNSSISNISTLQKEVGELVVEERVKKQGLHWKRKKEVRRSWADKWLVDNISTFEKAWSKLKEIMKKEPEKFDVAATYKIKFPPSLWNDLTEKERKHKKAEQIILGDDVPTYKFSSLIEEWERKTKINPVRGERDPNTKLDNNALFYGAPRTGKSVMAEKLAYEADVYPLVVIQGSSLTPRKNDFDAGIDCLNKFIFTLCDIDFVLADDFNFKRETNGEVRYILFIDEANQITTSTLISKSSELTFLKECMGSDNRINESQNLWIAATNHLDQVNPAVYQPGRLSNPLDFSWTLGDFMRYSLEAGINSQFPKHWIETETLSDEDNKWVNRFNKMYFDNDFIPFWKKFIEKNPNAEYEPGKEEEVQKNNNEGEKEKIKIKWGEMFEFFWNLFDSKQLEHFTGKFINPRRPTVEQVAEQVGNQISNSISTRLKELTETAEEIKLQSQEARSNCTSAIEDGLEQIRLLLSQMK